MFVKGHLENHSASELSIKDVLGFKNLIESEGFDYRFYKENHDGTGFETVETLQVGEVLDFYAITSIPLDRVSRLDMIEGVQFEVKL